jgi:hypothetical protein
MHTETIGSGTTERRLKLSLYPQWELSRRIDEGYAQYCQSIYESEKLVKPVSKSSWILALVRGAIAEGSV